MHSGFAILRNKKVQVCTIQALGEWLRQEPDPRRVARTEIGEQVVSTVFLTVDHGLDGMPLWFETMIFGGSHDGYQSRTATWEAASSEHERVVSQLRSGRGPNLDIPPGVQVRLMIDGKPIEGLFSAPRVVRYGKPWFGAVLEKIREFTRSFQ